MSRLKQGDVIICKLKLGKLVNSYASFDDKRRFEIIGLDNQGYCLFSPSYYNMLDTCRITNFDCKNYCINAKFVGDDMLYIVDTQVFSVDTILDGMHCKRCKQFYQMARANQEDGTLICYSCKDNPYR